MPKSMIITPLWIQVNENFIFEHLAIHFAILMFFTEVSGAQFCTRCAISVFVGPFRSPYVLPEKRVCYLAGKLVNLWMYEADDI